MTINLLALLFAAQCRALTPYSPESDAKALTSAAEATFQTINQLLSTQRDKERISKLKNLIDEEVKSGDASSVPAQALEGASQAAQEDMAAEIKSVENRLALSMESLDAAKKRLSAGSEAARKIKEDLSRLGKKNPEKEERLKKALAEIEAAGLALDKSGEALNAMTEKPSMMKGILTRARSVAGELRTAAADISAQAAAIREGSGPAKAAIDSLGEEPQEITRAKAWKKIETLVNAGKGVWIAADVALHRTDSFQQKRGSFQKESSKFEKQRKAASDSLTEAGPRLDAAEGMLSELRKWLDQ